MSLKSIAQELFFFINGETDSNILSDVGIKIWNKNSTREFLDNRGLPDREIGDLGPVYGFQWRHFNAPYSDCHVDYSGQGTDQLEWVIDELRTNPDSRRL